MLPTGSAGCRTLPALSRSPFSARRPLLLVEFPNATIRKIKSCSPFANFIYGFFVELLPELQAKNMPGGVFSGDKKFPDSSKVIFGRLSQFFMDSLYKLYGECHSMRLVGGNADEMRCTPPSLI
jgi:hypothetical protein